MAAMRTKSLRVRKLISIDKAVLTATQAFADKRGQLLEALFGAALRAYLAKHHRPISLKDALHASVRQTPANDHEPRSKKRSS